MTSSPDVPRSATNRIAWRLLPFLWLLYLIAYLDRANVAFANLEMSHALHFSDSVFGFGAGIFFVGYVLLEIPGAVIVERWSARRWLARIMISWGILAGLVGLVNTPHEFYGARFLLGVAEAGFFPGVIVYLKHWIREADRAKAIAIFITATTVANIIGSPIAGPILQVHWHGLSGWRWLFILEGVPAVVFGVATLFYLPDWPHQASWLPKAECDWITAELDREKKTTASSRSHTIREALRHREVLQLALIYFLGSNGVYGFTFWFPTILKRASGFSTNKVTLLGALPFVAALIAILVNGWSSDRKKERRWHTAVPLFSAGIFLIFTIASESHIWIQFICFVLFAGLVFSYQPIFWALPTTFLGESAAAASVGFINCIGGLGGFAGPYIIGYLSERTGSFTYGLCWLLFDLFAAGILVLLLRGKVHFDRSSGIPSKLPVNRPPDLSRIVPL
ncbi:MAG: MFS transporter [Candidatus Acidiferrales bacterium]